MAQAVNTLVETKGGWALVRGGKVAADADRAAAAAIQTAGKARTPAISAPRVP
jgi:hypothetical protein